LSSKEEKGIDGYNSEKGFASSLRAVGGKFDKRTTATKLFSPSNFYASFRLEVSNTREESSMAEVNFHSTFRR
jgi:hypothetical protein